VKKVNYLIFAGLLLCILFMLIGCTAPSILTPEEEINALIDKFGAGFTEEDVNKVLSCCHFPFSENYYNWNSPHLLTLSSYQDSLENTFAEVDILIDEFIDRNITFTSTSEAIVEATEHVEATYESGPMIAYYTVRLTCIKEGGSWKISEYIFLEEFFEWFETDYVPAFSTIQNGIVYSGTYVYSIVRIAGIDDNDNPVEATIRIDYLPE